MFEKYVLRGYRKHHINTSNKINGVLQSLSDGRKKGGGVLEIEIQTDMCLKGKAWELTMGTIKSFLILYTEDHNSAEHLVWIKMRIRLGWVGTG